MRLSRPCYDKPWRCPGWCGGGMKSAKVDRCDNGRIRGWDGRTRLTAWRFFRCDECDVVTWPFVTRYLDPTWWWSGGRYILSQRWRRY